MKIRLLAIFLVCYHLATSQNKVLVFHKTNGFEHSSIADGIKMIEDLGDANGLWSTESTTDASVFNEDNLSNYKVVVWCNTSGNNLLNNSQQTAFENFIKNGGGFVGIHAATDTYRDKSWPFYNDLVGAIIQRNPNHTRNNHSNTMDVTEVNKNHPAVSFINTTWDKSEEYYYWKNNGGQLFSGNKNLLVVRETTGSNGRKNDYDEVRPISWFKEFSGGRSFYTALGHNGSDYRNNDTFIKHVEEGIKWAGNLSDAVLSTDDFEINSPENQVFGSPNPVTNVLTINGLTAELTYDLHVRIFDMRGKQVLSQALSVSVNTINFSFLDKGIYFVKYSNTDIPSQRIVKQ
ncbi:ThuA domain-containing protein [Aquimarina agarivorans]|uniref:ThuA domain-containing protein n=1 Tax=Aquimarina agarivorans TaxID=980584 RepID=UPI000248EAB5|nr:ThuA domain-containing protein [Aquimarina agarivorans]